MKLPALTALTLTLISAASTTASAQMIDPASYDTSIAAISRADGQVHRLTEAYQQEMTRQQDQSMISEIAQNITTQLPPSPTDADRNPAPVIHDEAEKRDQEGERRTMPFHHQSAPIYTDHGNGRELVCPPGTHQEGTDIRCTTDANHGDIPLITPSSPTDEDESDGDTN